MLISGRLTLFCFALFIHASNAQLRRAASIHQENDMIFVEPQDFASSHAVLLSPDSAYDEDQHHRRTSSTGTNTVLIIRATNSRLSPPPRADELSAHMFSGAGSFAQQMSDCSAGAFQVVPTHYGVLEVQVGSQSSLPKFIEAAEKAALEKVGTSRFTNIRQVADHVVLVVPPGMESFVGSAEVGPGPAAALSFYNDRYGMILSVLMHEIGHNFGLRHASYNGDPYGDLTGTMGRSINSLRGPLFCFNAVNHWKLNWFTGNRREFASAPSTPTTVYLSAFVDSKKTNNPVLLKVGSLYMQYNRAKDHNRGTRAMGDQLVIIRDSGTSTTLLGGIGSGGTFRDGSMTVKVCSATNSGGVDTMKLRIGTGNVSCDDAPSTFNSPSTGSTNNNNGGSFSQDNQSNTNSWGSWFSWSSSWKRYMGPSSSSGSTSSFTTSSGSTSSVSSSSVPSSWVLWSRATVDSADGRDFAKAGDIIQS